MRISKNARTAPEGPPERPAKIPNFQQFCGALRSSMRVLRRPGNRIFYFSDKKQFFSTYHAKFQIILLIRSLIFEQF